MKRRSPNVSVSIYSNFQVRTDVLNRGKMQGKNDTISKLHLSYFGLEVCCEVILKSNNKRITGRTKGIFFN
jgi:hypothetical protein